MVKIIAVTKNSDNNEQNTEVQSQSEKNDILDSVNRILEYIGENIKSLTWLSTIIVTIITVVLKFVWFVLEAGRLPYWEIDYSAMSSVTDNSLYNIVLSFAISIVIYAFILLPFSIIRFNESGRERVVKMGGLFLVFSIVLFFVTDAWPIVRINVPVGMLVFLVFAIGCFGLVFLFSFLLSFLLSFLMMGPKNKKKTADENKNGFKVWGFVTWIAIEIVLMYISGYWFESLRTDFRVVDTKYAIIYENQEYYYMTKYNNESDIIDKEFQKIIKKENVEYQWEKINASKE